MSRARWCSVLEALERFLYVLGGYLDHPQIPSPRAFWWAGLGWARKILDERPLTKDFADTPLAGLGDALMAL